jgi:hypothetical protein
VLQAASGGAPSAAEFWQQLTATQVAPAVAAMDTSSPAGEAAAGAGVGVLKTEEQKNAESAGLFMERLEDSMKKKGDLWLRDEEEEDKVWARDPACVRGLRSASAGVAGLLGGWSLSTQFSLR